MHLHKVFSMLFAVMTEELGLCFLYAFRCTFVENFVCVCVCVRACCHIKQETITYFLGVRHRSLDRELLSKWFLSLNKFDVSRICEPEKEQHSYLSLPALRNSFENHWETFIFPTFTAAINPVSFSKPGNSMWEFHTLGDFYSS